MIRLRNLKKRFGTTVAVDDLSLDILEGETLGLIGPNGAGKSTTIAMAVGLLSPDSGTVEMGEWGSPCSPETRRHLGVAPQALSLYKELSGEENIRFFGQLQGLSGRRLADRVAWALDFVDLTDRRKDRVDTYSGGMQRRINLAVALIHDPPVLLLDEPTVGVDPQSRNSMFDKIEILHREGRTILYTTHHMEEAQRLCDRVAIMDHGKILALDSVPALVAAHGGKEVLTIENPTGEVCVETDNALRHLTELAKAGPLPPFRVETPNLESVFLNLTGRHLRD